MIKTPYVFLEDQLAGHSRYYQDPIEIICANTPAEVTAALARMETQRQNGYYLAGGFAYELGYVLEERLLAKLPSDLSTPLLQFGVFEGYSDHRLPDDSTAGNCRAEHNPDKEAGIFDLRPGWTLADYKVRFDKVMDWIKSGDVYQVNLTFPMHGHYHGDAKAVYSRLKKAQPVRYGGIISLGGTQTVSLSPELFFECGGDGKINMRPMKGTAARGRTATSDKNLAEALQADPKNRAENLMIVDLLRNDLSRISKPSSVKVTDLFTLETYPSLHTMTSGIEAQLATTSLADVIPALFPCGSVTGAPKIRAMEIIRALEPLSRGAYCGALGSIDPDGSMRFNVGIRTLTLDGDGSCRYGVGSGVVADSKAQDEYEECLLKSAFLTSATNPDFGLIETIAWHHQTGFMWLDLHLERLQKSANGLGFMQGLEELKAELFAAVKGLTGAHKIRLEMSKRGQIKIEVSPLRFGKPKTWRICLSKNPVSSKDIFRVHKTTKRAFLEQELARLGAAKNCREILLFNERDELCEGSFTNVFVRKDGILRTPPITCGLLPGIWRQVLIDTGDVVEQVLTQEDILQAETIYVGNSVRGLIKAELVSPHRI